MKRQHNAIAFSSVVRGLAVVICFDVFLLPIFLSEACSTTYIAI